MGTHHTRRPFVDFSRFCHAHAAHVKKRKQPHHSHKPEHTIVRPPVEAGRPPVDSAVLSTAPSGIEGGGTVLTTAPGGPEGGCDISRPLLECAEKPSPEPPPPVTTPAEGEEGGWARTLAIGEEGGSDFDKPSIPDPVEVEPPIIDCNPPGADVDETEPIVIEDIPPSPEQETPAPAPPLTKPGRPYPPVMTLAIGEAG